MNFDRTFNSCFQHDCFTQKGQVFFTGDSRTTIIEALNSLDDKEAMESVS